MYERRDEPLLTRAEFAVRWLVHFLVAIGFVSYRWPRGCSDLCTHSTEQHRRIKQCIVKGIDAGLFPRDFIKASFFSTPATPTPGQDVIWTFAGFVQVPDLGALKRWVETQGETYSAGSPR